MTFIIMSMCFILNMAYYGETFISLDFVVHSTIKEKIASTYPESAYNNLHPQVHEVFN